MILSQLRRRRGRALSLALGILVAATGFTLLTSAVTTSRAQTTGIVRHNARSAYDILVRPSTAQTSVERQRGLVQANFLSGVFGGITLGQYRRIEKLPGLDVAAPIANIGYLMVDGNLRLDVSRFLDSKASAQLLRLKPTVKAGLGTYPAADQYVYLTRNPITVRDDLMADTGLTGLDQERAAGRTYWVCWYYNSDKSDTTTGIDGKTLTPQAEPGYNPVPTSAFDLDARSRMTCRSGQGKASAEIPVTFPVLLSAVDPEAEDRLVGLGDTVTSGRMLTSKDRPVWGPDPFDSGPAASRQHDYQVPVMLSSHALTSTTLTASVERLDAGDPSQLPGKLGSPAAHRFVTALRGKTVGTVGADLDRAFRSVDRAVNFDTGGYWTVGPVAYGVTADGLVARSRPQQPADVWKNNLQGTSALLSDVPEENAGTQYRTVADHASTDCGGHKTCTGEDSGRAPIPVIHLVGRYDTTRLHGFSALSAVPLETYRSPQVTGADAATRSALGGRSLHPDRNLGGYLSPPPTLLTTLDSISAFTKSRHTPTAQEKAPVSAIRIRVAGVRGVDSASRARVNAVAARIHDAFPNLRVDVTVGSSPAPQTVALAAGLNVRENWTAKGVALRVLRAVDTKSAALFVLVLVVCGLFLTQAALASVRSRRTEIGTLRCTGWSAGEVLRLILGELAAVGLGAGTLGALLAYGLGALLGLSHSLAKAALVLPVALLLALLAGLIPAWRATRISPLDAVTAPVAPARRSVAVRSVAGLAQRHLLRTRGRTVLGAAGLALAVAAFTVLLSVTFAFRGEVAGSLLGDAVVARARTADYLSVTLTLVLGAAGAVDVLVMSQRERATDLAVLRATGWTTRELARLTLYEGLGLALLGSLTGAAAGLATVLALGEGVLSGHLLPMASAAGTAILVSTALVCAALAVPIRTLTRTAPGRVLAAD
ncbi:FtsX-like permease family protein [Streptomyces sp. NPDC001604]|uniref:FtsX-like permease family protein n=1 Tax=Streptomyces sp. NPDC001604 TaxID=3364593 RepID=UPI00369A5C12